MRKQLLARLRLQSGFSRVRGEAESAMQRGGDGDFRCDTGALIRTRFRPDFPLVGLPHWPKLIHRDCGRTAIGVYLLATGIPRGAISNIVLGATFTVQGIITLVMPRVLPPAPQLDGERVRARRVAVTVLPTGVLYILAALVLLVAVPERDRSGMTMVIAVALLALGVLNVLSGIGARKRVQRPDLPQSPGLPDDTDETDKINETVE